MGPNIGETGHSLELEANHVPYAQAVLLR
jgi:hypothetical protein